ncbi:phosphate metabolism protein 7 [Microsporum audouinii]
MDTLNVFAKRDEPEKPSDASNSLSGLVSTLVPTLIISAVMVLLFVILRRSQRRQYIPRTYIGALREQERTPPPEPGFFGWLKSMSKLPDTYVLRHQSLDAYLLLRYLKIATAICFFGCFITWPVLFPVNITGHGGRKQLDMLAIGNVTNKIPGNLNRFYAHCFIAWIFVGFVFWMVTRELLYFINLRQAYFMSPLYAERISSKTVLFTSVPAEYCDEARIRSMYGNDKVKNVWLVTDVKELEKLVEERDKAAFRLEGAETKLIKMANVARGKALQKVAEVADPAAEGNIGEAESGSVAARWVKPSKRPTHRLLPIIGRKVDTINWTREEIGRLTPLIDEMQNRHINGDATRISAVFVEFYTQNEAQAAYQMLAHNLPLHMAPRYIGLGPDEIIWSNLRIKWWELIIRYAVTVSAVTALIIFWAIPVAAVGAISNINFLMEKVPFLRFIGHIPPVILGVVTALLPTILLSVLMALLPIVLRLLAKLGGCPTKAAVELRTQNFYFGFQVVQVFLVVTLSSAASSAVSDIIKNPTSAPGLLARSIPTVSNFYISYIILQGLTFSAGALLQISGLIISKILGMILDNTPRKMYTRWSSLAGMGWGTILPVLTNLVVIAITYGAIAPLVLGFGAIGMFLFYFSFRYNLLYVNDTDIDTKGMIYPRALKQTLVGCYLLIICLIGLFAIGTASDRAATGPMVLMIIFLVFTVLYHVSLLNAVNPLLKYLPKNLEAVEEQHQALLAQNNGQQAPDARNGDAEKAGGPSGKKPNMFAKFFAPHKYESYEQLRELVPHGAFDTDYPTEVEKNAYYHPSITSTAPLLWIPRDEAGVSRQEVLHTSRYIPITDDDATMDTKGKIAWDEERGLPPIHEEKIYY